jgi:hypothetical protein
MGERPDLVPVKKLCGLEKNKMTQRSTSFRGLMLSLPVAFLSLMVMTIPTAFCSEAPTTRLNETQVVQLARAFCQKIGQPVTAIGTATFATNLQGPPGHYWQPVWDVTFPAQAEVEIVDTTGIITNYANDAYSIGHQDNASAGEAIPQQEAIQRARKAVDTAGESESLIFWEAQLDQGHPGFPLASSYNWMIRWYRAAGGVPYRNQHVSVALDAQTGEIKFMVLMFGSPPLASAAKVLSQADAISVATSQVISQVVRQEATHKETHLEIVAPDDRWYHSSNKPGQLKNVRLAWAVTYIVDGIWRQTDVDAETGEILGTDSDSGPWGRQAVVAPTRVFESPPLAQILKTAQAVYIRGKDAKGTWTAKPFLKFSAKTQPHAVALLTQTADFHKQAPSEAASQQLVLVSRRHAIGVYSYFPQTGLVGSGTEWAAVPEEFQTWMQHKLASVPATRTRSSKK